jgi:hypothetical protein
MSLRLAPGHESARSTLAHSFLSRDGTARVRQAIPLQPGRNLQITVGRMATNVLAYFAEGESGVTPRSMARGQAAGLGSGESLAPTRQPLMPRLSMMYQKQKGFVV